MKLSSVGNMSYSGASLEKYDVVNSVPAKEGVWAKRHPGHLLLDFPSIV